MVSSTTFLLLWQVTNYVPYSDVDSLKAWSDHAAMAQWKQLMDGSTLKREVLGWQEREDNTSHQMLYFHAVRALV